MDILFLLLPIAVIFLILAIAFFFWAIKNGQYDDFESQALKVVMDDHQQSKEKLSDIEDIEPNIKEKTT